MTVIGKAVTDGCCLFNIVGGDVDAVMRSFAFMSGGLRSLVLLNDA